MSLNSSQATIDVLVDPADCKVHYPVRVYVWDLNRRMVCGTCQYCHSDYEIPRSDVVDLCLSPTPTNAKTAFHEMFSKACKEYFQK